MSSAHENRTLPVPIERGHVYDVTPLIPNSHSNTPVLADSLNATPSLDAKKTLKPSGDRLGGAVTSFTPANVHRSAPD